MKKILLVAAFLVSVGIAYSLGVNSVEVECPPVEKCKPEIVEVIRNVTKEIEVTRLFDKDLEEILLLDGDLPTSFVGQQIMSDVTSYFTELPEPSQFIQQEFHKKFRSGFVVSDGVVIILYEDREFIEDAFNILHEKIKRGDDVVEIPIEGIGEKAILTKRVGISLVSVNMVFVRCQAVVYIELFSSDVDVELLTNYAKRLDKRINQLVCD